MLFKIIDKIHFRAGNDKNIYKTHAKVKIIFQQNE